MRNNEQQFRYSTTAVHFESASEIIMFHELSKRLCFLSIDCSRITTKDGKVDSLARREHQGE